METNDAFHVDMYCFKIRIFTFSVIVLTVGNTEQMEILLQISSREDSELWLVVLHPDSHLLIYS